MENNLTSLDESNKAVTPSVQLTTKLSDLLSDVINLATYALEAGRLPDTVNFSVLYGLWEKKIEKEERLTAKDVDYLQYCYQQLEATLSPISAISLRATDVSGARKRKDYLNTEAGIYAKQMWTMAFMILAVIISINLYQYTFDMYAGDWAVNNTEIFGGLTIFYWLAGSLTPFAYGAFGASVRLLRITETRLRERSFDPRRLAEHRNRLVLGTLSGGVVVLVYSTGGVGDPEIKLTEAGLGFLAGYSIDLLFSILDRLVKAISPDEPSSTNKSGRKTVTDVKKSFAEVEIEKAANVVSSSDYQLQNLENDAETNTSPNAGPNASVSTNTTAPHLKPVKEREPSKNAPTN